MSLPRVRTETIEGVAVTWEYHDARRAVRVEPDEEDVAAAGLLAVLTVWAAVGDWARRFLAANPGWSVNGTRAADGDPFDLPDEDDP